MAEALHFSAGKPGVEQIPPEFLMEIGTVFTYGEKKYARDNWKAGTNWSQMYGSALRHLFKFMMGQDYDECDGSPGCTPEAEFCKIHSRLHHLAQAAWNIMAMRYWQIHDKGVDDRDPPPIEVQIEPIKAKYDEAFVLNKAGDIVGVQSVGVEVMPTEPVFVGTMREALEFSKNNPTVYYKFMPVGVTNLDDMVEVYHA